MLSTMLEMIKCLESDSGSIRRDLEGLRLQTEVAQSVAEDAIQKAHETEEKFEDSLADFKHDMKQIKVNMEELEKKMLKSFDVQQMIDESFRKAEHTAAVTSRSSSSIPATRESFQKMENEERYGKTLVFGGFERESPREDITRFIEQNIITSDYKGIDEIYAYAIGSIGFVRFTNKNDMYKFLKEYGGRGKSRCGDREIWAAVSRFPEERKKGTVLSKWKKMLIEASIAEAADVKIDYKNGIIFLKRIKIGKWSALDAKLDLDAENLKEAGIQAEPQQLVAAVSELLGSRYK